MRDDGQALGLRLRRLFRLIRLGVPVFRLRVYAFRVYGMGLGFRGVRGLNQARQKDPAQCSVRYLALDHRGAPYLAATARSDVESIL